MTSLFLIVLQALPPILGPIRGCAYLRSSAVGVFSSPPFVSIHGSFLTDFGHLWGDFCLVTAKKVVARSGLS